MRSAASIEAPVTPSPRVAAPSLAPVVAIRAVGSLKLGVATFVLYLQLTRGFSIAQIALAGAFYWVAVLLAELPAGAIADRVGPRGALLLATSCVAVSRLIAIYGSGTAAIGLAYALWGAGTSVWGCAENLYLVDTLEARGEGATLGAWLGRFAALETAMAVLGAGVGALLLPTYGLVAPLFLGAASCAACFAIALRSREPRARPASLGVAAQIRRAWRVVLGSPRVTSLVLLRAGVIGGVFGAKLLVQPMLYEEGSSTTGIALASIPLDVLAVGGALLAARARRTMGLRGVLGAGPAVVVLLFVALGASSAVPALVVFGIVSFAEAVLHPIVRRGPRALRARRRPRDGARPRRLRGERRRRGARPGPGGARRRARRAPGLAARRGVHRRRVRRGDARATPRPGAARGTARRARRLRLSRTSVRAESCVPDRSETSSRARAVDRYGVPRARMRRPREKARQIPDGARPDRRGCRGPGGCFGGEHEDVRHAPVHRDRNHRLRWPVHARDGGGGRR
jgi:predicted MFS family arabinose efflux permease